MSFYVRILREHKHTGDGYEVVCTGHMEETTLPRQGDWMLLEMSENHKIHSMVKKLTAHYHTRQKDDYKTIVIDYYEIIIL